MPGGDRWWSFEIAFSWTELIVHDLQFFDWFQFGPETLKAIRFSFFFVISRHLKMASERSKRRDLLALSFITKEKKT